MITPEQLREARQIAELARAIRSSGGFYHDVKVLEVEEFDDFVQHFDPPFVLQLLDEVEFLRKSLDRIKSEATL